MAHPQSSGRGYISHDRVDVGTQQLTDDATHLVVSGGVKVSNAAGGALTASATHLTLAKGITISGLQSLTGNSTAIVHGSPESAIPTTDNGAAWTVVSNSTGVAIAVNTTGTTWKYLNVTSVQPT